MKSVTELYLKIASESVTTSGGSVLELMGSDEELERTWILWLYRFALTSVSLG